MLTLVPHQFPMNSIFVDRQVSLVWGFKTASVTPVFQLLMNGLLVCLEIGFGPCLVVATITVDRRHHMRSLDMNPQTTKAGKLKKRA